MTEQNFRIAVDAILKNWTALQLAVQQGAAGPHSQAVAAWMVDATVQWFSENKNLDNYEVEEFFEEILNREFNLLVQDGSVKDTSRLICEYFALCNSNMTNESIQEKLRQLPKCDLSKCKVDLEECDDGEHESEDLANEMFKMNVGETSEKAENKEQEVDPDGWTTVVSRKKK